MKTLLTILLNGVPILSTVMIGIETAMKIKALMELDPDFQVNVERLTMEALVADQDTMTRVAAWRQKVGLPPLTPEPPLGEEQS